MPAYMHSYYFLLLDFEALDEIVNYITALLNHTTHHSEF